MPIEQAPSAVAEIVGGLINLSATGIIGVFMLRVLPAIAGTLATAFRDGIAKLGEILKAERDGYEVRSAKLAAEIDKMRTEAKCKYQP